MFCPISGSNVVGLLSSSVDFAGLLAFRNSEFKVEMARQIKIVLDSRVT
jgi:hypothetical protein